MMQGKLFLSCGCEHTDAMPPWETLDWTFWSEECTRDPDNPFVMAQVTGSYCPDCRKRLTELGVKTVE